MCKTKSFYVILALIIVMFKIDFCFSQNNQIIDSLISEGNIHFINNNYDSAEYYFKQALDLDKNNVNVLILLAKNEYQQMDILDININKNYQIAKSSEKYRSSFDRFRFSRAMDYIEKALKIDPNNLEANYIAGILMREKLRLKFTIMKSGAFSDGEKYFQKIINENPKYKDVYLQYSMLLRYYDKYSDALDTCYKSILLKPSMSENYISFRRIVNDFIREADKDDILKYCNEENNIFKCYILAEYERINKNYDRAFNLFTKIINNYNFTPNFYTNYHYFPITLAYSSLLKILAKENEVEKLNNLYWNAVNTIKNDIEANILFDDIKYLITPEEISKYYNMNFEEKRSKFFVAFWNRRHPETNMDFSQRLFEHYKRLVDAEKEYYLSRERVLFKKPSDSYELNCEFTDQGLIFIKYGKPDKINKTTNYSIEEENPFYSLAKFNADTNTSPSIKSFGDDSLIYQGPINEAWLYKPTPYNKKMIFCFIGMSKKLTTNFFDKEILKDIKDWDENIFRYLNSFNSTEEDEMIQKIVKVSKEQLFEGINSERSSIKNPEKSITIPNKIYEFKGEKGKTKLKVAYYLPVNTIFEALPKGIDTLKIENGYMILDKDYNTIGAKIDTILITKKNKDSFSQIKYLYIDVDPDSIEVNLFFNPLNSNITCFYKDRFKPRNFTTNELSISDILIAAKIEKTNTKGFFTKNNIDVYPSPTTKYPLNKLLNIYYEIYGLTKNRNGNTIYNVEYSFKYSGSDENLLKKIFSSKEGETTSTEYSKSGKDVISNEYISFDVSNLKEGTYEFEVIVKDINAQKTVKKSITIELFD